MKSQHIIVTVLVLSVCQWSVLGQAATKETAKDDKTPVTTEPTPTTKPTPTTIPPSTTTTPDTTSVKPNSTTPTTPTTTTTTTSTSTTQVPPTTPTPTTTTTTTTPPPPTPTPAPSGRHFDAPSFIGGIVLTIGLIAIGIVGHKIYKAKFDRNYHTL